MADIEERKAHNMGKEKARLKAEEIANRMKDKMGMQWSWAGDTINFSSTSGASKGVKGTVEVSDTEIIVRIDLPFLLKAMKSMIRSKVRENLDGVQ